MHRGITFSLLALLTAALVFLLSTSDVAEIARRNPSAPDTTQGRPAAGTNSTGNRTQVPTPHESAAPDTLLPPAEGSSGLIIPVQGIRRDQLVDTYTASRSEGRTHNAIDILAPRNTPVLAAAGGTVVRLFLSEKGGKTIYELAPDSSTVYYYAHLDHYADGLAKGQTVRQGQIIGYVGDTGDAAPGNYHLHFAIWITEDPHDFWNGKNVNPYPLLKAQPGPSGKVE